MRTFVAIDLPLPVQMALGSVGAQLRAALPGQRLRWVAPDHIHLTIKFLGEISSQQAEALAADLLAVAAALAPIELALGAAGCFSQRGAPSALWVGLRGEITPLNRLQRAVEAAALARGHRLETRAFRPHLTLGRFGLGRPAAAAPLVAAALQNAAVSQSVEWTARDFSLMRSELLQGGARYTCMHKFELGGG